MRWIAIALLFLTSCSEMRGYYLVEQEIPIHDTIMIPAIHHHTENNECVYIKGFVYPLIDTIRISYYERR
jgi:hypothetical protein